MELVQEEHILEKKKHFYPRFPLWKIVNLLRKQLKEMF